MKCQHMPRPLTSAEYEQMMSEFDEAEEWMRDQMKAKSTVSIPSRSLRNDGSAIHEDSAVRAPDNVSGEEAATLPIAARSRSAKPF